MTIDPITVKYSTRKQSDGSMVMEGRFNLNGQNVMVSVSPAQTRTLKHSIARAIEDIIVMHPA